MKNNDRELQELRQFVNDARCLDAIVIMSRGDLKDRRDHFVDQFHATDVDDMERRAYLIGKIHGIDEGLKAFASPLDFGMRWIREPEPKKPQLRLVIDNTKESRPDACDVQGG